MTYEDLVEKKLATRSILRTCVTNMSDSLQNRKLILNNLEKTNHSEIKKANKIREWIKELNYSDLENSEDLKSVVYLIAKELNIENNDVLESYNYSLINNKNK